MGETAAGRERVLEALEKATEDFGWDSLGGLAAAALGEELGMSRTVVSQYLNQYLGEELAVKVNTRPVYFFHRQTLEERFEGRTTAAAYGSVEELREDLKAHKRGRSAFQQSVGAAGSLGHCVEQCKAAMTYPGGGLPILLQGPTGTGKSFIAKLMYDYGVERGVLSPESRLVTVNCSEYANNPELLLTNLFGHKRGAYTGAERDRTGLLALADKGVLFLDEVHCLKSECQEKLFLFMDQGIYHMVGDNERWYRSQVRIIFATTESPECVLLKTLLRRIPIVTRIPALADRPLQEKKELLCQFLRRESEQTGRTIRISALAYHALLEYDFPGNVGQMVNCVRASVAKAFVRQREDPEGRLDLHLYDLPAYLVAGDLPSVQEGRYDDKELLGPERLGACAREESKLSALGKGILDALGRSAPGEREAACLRRLEQYTDYLFYSGGAARTPKEEVTISVLTGICASVAKKHSRRVLSNNEVIALAKFLCDYLQNSGGHLALLKRRRGEVQRAAALLEERWPGEYAAAKDFQQLFEGSLGVTLDGVGFLELLLFLRSFQAGAGAGQVPGITLAHGYSTASSIAQAANHLLGRTVFDAIDMPVESRPQSVARKLSEYLGGLGGCREAVVLVDMGSLEDIYQELDCPGEMDVGIINNVNTRLALDIGTMLLEGKPVQEILETASGRSRCHYTIHLSRRRPPAILTVCATGIGTAEKIARLIEGSLPRPVSLLAVPYDFGSLRDEGTASPAFRKYQPALIVGTLDPGVPGVPFVSVEEMVTQENEELMDRALAPLLTPGEIGAFHENVIKNFSLQNLLDYLTILNPEKIVAHVERIITNLQERLGITLASSAKVGLYLHISCLIERLITDRYIVDYAGLAAFTARNQEFIRVVKECFAEVERSYSVEIPVSEMGYLHDYLCQAAPAVTKLDDPVTIFDD